MQKREVIKYLKRNGFTFLRNGTNHEFWVRGSQVVTLSKGRKVENRLFKKIKTDVRRGYARFYCEVQRC